MQPRLFAIAGPLKDSTLPLQECDPAPSGATDSSAADSTTESAFFHEHCRLRKIDGRFQILDLENRSGTLVNGRSVKQEWLNHGDEIAVGDSVFVFLMEDGHQKPLPPDLPHPDLLHKASPRPARFEHSLVGEGPRMQEIDRFLMRVAPTDSTVLVEGESGTGKELIARALHRHSTRAKERFVAINCAAIPDSLLEDDLFGHERGAFTGAVNPKQGRLEVADGGVVFLDEIGELAPSLQVKLLRVLQEREFERLGGTRPIKVNIRLVAATNCDLNAAVKGGKFRQDLYYRLAVVCLRMPGLRERKEDIPLLANHFVQKYATACNVKAKPISREAMVCFSRYDWPGNVRELENAIEHALVLGQADHILPGDLPESVINRWSSPVIDKRRYHARVKELKKKLIVEAVEQTRNYVDAAALLGLHPNYLHRLIRKLDLRDSLKKDLPRYATQDDPRGGHTQLSHASHGAA